MPLFFLNGMHPHVEQLHVGAGACSGKEQKPPQEHKKLQRRMVLLTRGCVAARPSLDTRGADTACVAG